MNCNVTVKNISEEQARELARFIESMGLNCEVHKTEKLNFGAMIDQNKREIEVQEIVNSEYYQDIRQKAMQARLNRQKRSL